MLGPISNSNKPKSASILAQEAETQKVLEELIVEINHLKNKFEDLESVFETELLKSNLANITRLDSNLVKSQTVDVETISAKIAQLQEIISPKGAIDHLTVEQLVVPELNTQLKSIQESLNVLVLQTNSLTAETIKAQRAVLDEIVTKIFSIYKLTVTEIGANSISSDYGRIKSFNSDSANITEIESEKGKVTELESETISTKELESDSVSVKQITGTDEEGEYNLPGILKNARQEGFSTLNLDPQLIIANDDSYLVKVKKNYSSLDLEVADSFALRVSNSYSRNDLTKSASLVFLHQSLMKEVLGIAEDEDYLYVRIQPHNTNELTYRYTSKEKLEISFEYNGVIPTTQVYYEPAALSEIIFLGDSTDNYQFTILGKLKASLTDTVENSRFKDITVENNIWAKDYFDEQLEKWQFTKGTYNQYLSIEKESYDPVFGWTTHIAWKTPVDNTEVGPLEKSDRLVTANTLGNFNGKSDDENNITKLGEVDEGEWNAGAITSNESLDIKHETIKWQDKDYQVWLNGSSPEESDFEWARR